MSSRVLVPLMALLAIAVPAHAQIRKTGGGYLFRQKFVQGRTYSYSFLIDMSTPTSNAPIRVSGPLKMKILSVKGTTARIQASAGPFSMNGQNLPQAGQEQTTTVEETNTGQIIGGGDQIQQMAIALPQRPIKPGATWSGSTKLNLYGGAEKVATHYRFIGMAKSAGHQVARLGVSLVGAGQTKVTGNGEVYLLTEDCSIWLSTTRFTVELQQIKMKGVTKIIRR